MRRTRVSTRSLAPGVQVVEHYGDWPGEYRAVREGLALIERSERGWVALGGADRAAG